jgi:hypothetical protein
MNGVWNAQAFKVECTTRRQSTIKKVEEEDCVYEIAVAIVVPGDRISGSVCGYVCMM